MSIRASSRAGPQTGRRRSFMAQPFKHRVSGIYYLRRKVPDELRAALGREFKRSLKTTDAAEAKARFAAAWSESEQAFAAARTGATAAQELTQEDAQQVAARWFRDAQARAERTGQFAEFLDTYTERGLDPEQEGCAAIRTFSEAAQTLEDDEWAAAVQPFMAQAVRLAKLPLPAGGTVPHSRLLAAMDEHLRRLSDWAMRRATGERPPLGEGVMPHAPLTAEVPSTAAAHSGRCLGALVDSYATAKRLNDGDTRATRRTISAYRAVIAGFIEFYGDMRADTVTRDTIAGYRGLLAQLPAKGEGTRGMSAPKLIEKADREGLPRIQAPTISNRLRALSAVLGHGVTLGWVTENPVSASGIGRLAAKAATRSQAQSRKRKDYTPDELRAIFTSPAVIDPTWKPPRAEFGAAWRWLPLLLYYTGARREELAQLDVSDVCTDPAGIVHLSILATDDGDDSGRTVKTAGSRRLVPVHPDLVRRGFMTYVESLPARGRLFPALQPDPKGYFGTNFGKRWAAYLRESLGLTGSPNPSHGFRHTFKTLCRGAGIPEDVHDAITGHAGTQRVARGYGAMPLARMATELARLPAAPAAQVTQPGAAAG